MAEETPDIIALLICAASTLESIVSVADSKLRDLPPWQFRLFLEISKGSVSPTALAENRGLSRETIYSATKALSSLSLITVTYAPHSRRDKLLRLSATGWKALENYRAERARASDLLVDAFGSARTEQFKAMLEEIFRRSHPPLKLAPVEQRPRS